MVNDNVERASQRLDFSFVPNYQDIQQKQQEVILQRSCSGYDLVSKDLPHVSKDLLVSPLIDRGLVNSADNLSWTFFEQVSSVDNHLRFDESGDTASYAGQLMPITANDVNQMVAEEQTSHEPEQQQHQLTIANKSNGSTIAVDIVSQNPAALIKPKQHKRNNSIINVTVEGTLKQTTQKQQLQPKQYHNNNNNNQKGLITKNNQLCNHNNDQPPSPLYPQHQQQQNKIPPPTNDINHCDATATAMITGGTLERERDTAAAGINTSRSTRIRNLPAISKLTPVYAEGVDIVGDTKRKSKIQQEQESGQQLGRVKMGATSQSFVEGLETHLGLVGWRKKCLYTLLVLLMLLIIVNLVLTLWILKVMEFSTEGMGQLKIIPGGIQLTGQALIMDMLRASTIRSRHGQPISIESSRNFSINTRDTNGILENHLFLGHDKLECLSTGFHINDTTGRNLFSVNRDEVTIGAHALRIDGEGGAIFRESIQTPHVRAEPGRELRLESPTRQLELTAAKDINLQSRAGGIELSALEDVKLSALDGSLRLESSKILMPNLRTAQPPLPGTAQNREHLHRVFQLCACSNGKLFLAAPHSICAGDDSTVCR